MDGLWQGPTALSEDFGTIAYRMQLLGFNTVRLPMSFQVCVLILHACACNLITHNLAEPCKPAGTWFFGRNWIVSERNTPVHASREFVCLCVCA